MRWRRSDLRPKAGELRLEQWEERDNRERLACEAKWRRKEEDRKRFLATWLGRRVYPAYAWLVHGCFGMPLYKFWHRVGSTCDRIGRAIDRLGNKLAPYGDPIRAEHRRRVWSELLDDED